MRGLIKSIKFRAEDGMFIIARLESGDIVKGNMPTARIGGEYEFKGEWQEHPRFGKQFLVESYRAVSEKLSLEGVISYLQTFPFLGAATAKKIVNAYGQDALTVLKDDPERAALEIKGLTLARVREISTAMIANQKREQLQVELAAIFTGTKMPRTMMADVIAAWADEAPQKIRADPYVLKNLRGIGFLIADSVALKIGFAKDHPYRIAACIEHVIEEAAGEGHVCLPLAELKGRVLGALN
jgi:exodeoxyribonuclease V alpha subunit